VPFDADNSLSRLHVEIACAASTTVRMAAPNYRRSAMSEPTTVITGVRTIGVPVTDQDRALAFYVDQLGLEKRLDAAVEQLGGRWIEVAPDGGAITIALVPAHDGVPAGVETGIRFTTPDAAAVHAELQERGVDVGELLRWPGVPPMFAVRDQDGNGLEIVEQP
jgi:lactoylglutathione lyase